MKIFDTAREALVELDVHQVARIYTCGITPYDAAHMGHAAVYVTFDLLQRNLARHNVVSTCVRNVTDVDDDILRKARTIGANYLDLAAREMAKFDRDMAGLGLARPHAEPRATSAIPEILTMVGDLMDGGFAYQVDGWVYFEVAKAPHFGKVSHLPRDMMMELAAERGGNPGDLRKRDPLDFVLWQPSLPDEPSWESRFGPGRPGWHIECSALAMRELGPVVDIHGGGSDLIFPHHECEAAQTEAITGGEFVKHWMHVGMVCLDGVKMSKSLGNLVFVGDLLKDSTGEEIRLAILSHHYRSTWDWSDAVLASAKERIARWRSSGPGRGAFDEVAAALDNDLDTPTAIAAIERAVAEGQGVRDTATLLGIDLEVA
ncbi:cysteine--tRNA ligase [Ferrimicrobium sp.]|uniref:cysteine--tRNA ligase n=1 Tax=Ferrimicrobium sp. TaxID=2926050 RepID=UPI002622B269|nr:cysteine--tRNA ligase [Ferrimicrobium sp.]